MGASIRGISAGEAFVKLSADDTAAMKAINRVKGGLRSMGSVARAAGVHFAKLGAVAATAMAGAVVSFAKTGDALHKMSKRTGVAVEALSALDFAANRSGASIEDVEKGIRGMQRQIGTAGVVSAQTADTLAKLGLSVDKLRGMKPEDQFRLIAERIKRIKDPTQQAAAAMAVFGRAGTALLPLIKDDMGALMDEAKELGSVLTNEDAEAAARLTDAMGDLKAQLGAVAVRIGAELAPAITDLMNQMKPLIADTLDWKGFWAQFEVDYLEGTLGFSEAWGRMTSDLAASFIKFENDVKKAWIGLKSLGGSHATEAELKKMAFRFAIGSGPFAGLFDATGATDKMFKLTPGQEQEDFDRFAGTIDQFGDIDNEEREAMRILRENLEKAREKLKNDLEFQKFWNAGQDTPDGSGGGDGSGSDGGVPFGTPRGSGFAEGSALPDLSYFERAAEGFDQARTAITSSGTFSGQRLGDRFGSQNVDREILRAIKDQTHEIKNVERAIEQGGTFT